LSREVMRKTHMLLSHKVINKGGYMPLSHEVLVEDTFVTRGH